MDQLVRNVQVVLCICAQETRVKAQRKQSCIHQLLLLISRFIGLINVELNRTPVETNGEISLRHSPTPIVSLAFPNGVSHSHTSAFLVLPPWTPWSKLSGGETVFAACGEDQGKYELHSGSAGHYSKSWRKIMVTISKTPAEKPL